MLKIIINDDGHTDIVESLIGANVNINATPLSLASLNGHTDVIKLLKKNGTK